MAKSSTKRRGGKSLTEQVKKFIPAAKRRTFPLSAHSSGAWQKWIKPKGSANGRTFYFGRWGKRVGGKMVIEPEAG